MVDWESYRYSKFTLRFPEKRVEHSFNIFSFSYDIQAFAVMSIAAIVVNLILVFSDYSKIGEWVEPLILRSTIAILLSVGYFITSRVSHENPRLLQSFILVVVFIFIFCYFIGMYYIPYPDYSFPNSIISVVFFVVAIAGLRFANAMIFLVTVNLSYYVFVLVIAPNEFWISQSVAITVNAALGVAVAYLIERARRNTFIKNQIISEQNDELESAGALKNKLFSILSHDLRGPVNKILAMVDMLKKDHISIEEFKMHTAKVEWEMKNTASFMENMLYWSKSLMNGFQIDKKDIDLKKLIEKNVAVWRDSILDKKINLFIHAQKPMMIRADEEMLNVCVRNLLSNAIKFTPPEESITVGYVEADNWIELYVSDSGIGIDEEKQKGLFSIKNASTPGTLGEKGTGIGLHLVKEFTERIGGEISCESLDGQGSTFKLRFPKNDLSPA